MKKICSLLLIFILLINSTLYVSLSVFAYNEDNYENAGYDFLFQQYDLKNIEYANVQKLDAINLYDLDDNVVAKMMIVDRDGFIDYVILDFMVDRVDEYGFDQADFVTLFSGKDKVYYAGLMNYAYYNNDNLLCDIYGSPIDEKEYRNTMDWFVQLEAPQATIYDGFMSYSDVQSKIYNVVPNSGLGGTIDNTAWDYLPEILTSGIASESLAFQSQQYLNNEYYNEYGVRITGTCAAVAITNMMIYFDYIGFENALINNSIEETFFDALYQTDKANWTNDNWWNKTVSGFHLIANNSGYEYTINQYETLTWNDVVDSISLDVPIWTYINYKQETYSVAHAVVTVGYEEFTHTYTTTEKYGFLGLLEKTITHEVPYCYLRVIDGWSTSNSSRYIDFNGFYTTVKGIGFAFN